MLSALLLDGLGSSVCFIGLQKTGSGPCISIILEFGCKMYLNSLQEVLISDAETLSISNIRFAVLWIAESSKAIGLPTAQTRTHTRTTLAKIKTYQPTLAQTKEIPNTSYQIAKDVIIKDIKTLIRSKSFNY